MSRLSFVHVALWHNFMRLELGSLSAYFHRARDVSEPFLAETVIIFVYAKDTNIHTVYTTHVSRVRDVHVNVQV